ncbi:MAG: 4Fe-4S dicluster domain-containing protein [Georgenia sp.]
MTAAGLHRLQNWLAHQGEPIHLELVCAEHPAAMRGERGRTVVRAPSCLAAVERHEVVELLTVGASRVSVRLDGCPDAAAVRARLAGLADLLTGGLVLEEAAATGPLRTARHRPVLDAGHLPVSRRQVLGLGARTARDLPATYLAAPDRLTAALRDLGVAAGAAATPGDAVALAAPGCVACGVCVRACPFDALRLAHAGGGNGPAITTLLQDPARCDGCMRCTGLCPTTVLTATGHHPWSVALAGAEVPVSTLTTTVCTRCSMRFPTTSGERLCPTCAYRRQNPFGSALPPVLAERLSPSTAR